MIVFYQVPLGYWYMNDLANSSKHNLHQPYPENEISIEHNHFWHPASCTASDFINPPVCIKIARCPWVAPGVSP